MKGVEVELNKHSFVCTSFQDLGGEDNKQSTVCTAHKVCHTVSHCVVIEHDKQSDVSKTHKECGVREQKNEVLSAQFMKVWELEYYKLSFVCTGYVG